MHIFNSHDVFFISLFMGRFGKGLLSPLGSHTSCEAACLSSLRAFLVFREPYPVQSTHGPPACIHSALCFWLGVTPCRPHSVLLGAFWAAHYWGCLDMYGKMLWPEEVKPRSGGFRSEGAWLSSRCLMCSLLWGLWLEVISVITLEGGNNN